MKTGKILIGIASGILAGAAAGILSLDWLEANQYLA